MIKRWHKIVTHVKLSGSMKNCTMPSLFANKINKSSKKKYDDIDRQIIDR
jgi:hypothetical protein